MITSPAFDHARVPLQLLERPWPDADGIVTYLARLDALHSHYGGNKWFKLKYNLQRAASEGHKNLITFGGAYSNHLRATAAAAREFGFGLTCVVRGEAHHPLNPVLSYVSHQGASLYFVSRSDYRRSHEISFIETLEQRFGPAYVIPEGGANAEGVYGSREIIDCIDRDFDVVVCACGTFTTLCGLSLNLKSHQQAVGIAVLKADGYAQRQMESLTALTLRRFPDLPKRVGGISQIDDFHFGGYAKRNQQLDSFMHWMKETQGVETDFVYTAKALFAVKHLIENRTFKPGSRIVVLYTGVTDLAHANA